MKTNFNFKDAKEGDKVYHVAKGWIEIIALHPWSVETYDFKLYNLEGKEDEKDENPTIYPYNPFEQNQERVVEVLNSYGSWIKRVCIAKKNKGVVCWNSAESLDEAEYSAKAIFWTEWREIEPEKELTQEEKINLLWENFGKNF